MKKSQGFSLIELSISLTIIALLIAAVAGGQSLVQNARLNKIVRNIEQYQSAINTFYTAYSALPGDFSKASTYFSCSSCDGSGNGYIDGNELYYFWNHLGLAGMIAKTYTISTSQVTAGTTHPVDEFGIYGALYVNYSGWISDNVLSLAKLSGSTLFYSNAAMIEPDQAYSIDKKYDDGIAYKGNIISLDGANVTLHSCSDIFSDTSPDDYYETTGRQACRMFFRFNTNARS